MKHIRRYADYAKYFGDPDYVAERLAVIRSEAVSLDSGCVVLPSVDRTGYAKAYFGGRSWQAHRLLWIIENGDVGRLVIDHKCRNRACVNLAHLEPVTNQENIRRGRFHAHGGKCSKGHERTLVASGWLACPECKREAALAHYHELSSDPDWRRRRNERDRQRRAAKKLELAATRN